MPFNTFDFLQNSQRKGWVAFMQNKQKYTLSVQNKINKNQEETTKTKLS